MTIAKIENEVEKRPSSVLSRFGFERKAMKAGGRRVAVVAIAAAMVGALTVPAVAASYQQPVDYAPSAAELASLDAQQLDSTGEVIATVGGDDVAATTPEQLAAAEAEIAAAAAAEAEAAATAAAEAEAASDGTTAPAAALGNGTGIAAVASAALAQVGVGQDCFALVRNSYAGAGYSVLILESFTPIPMSEAGPGDLLYYSDGGMGLHHVAIYIGGGQAVHGGWNGGTTVVASAYVGSGPVAYRLIG